MKKQFDLSHIRIDERLQGAHLANFSRRAGAFAVDWGILFLCFEFEELVFLLAVILLVVKRKLGDVVQVGQQVVQTATRGVEQLLADQAIEQALKERFTRYMRYYLYVLMYAPLAGLAVMTTIWTVRIVQEGKDIFTRPEDFKFLPFAEMYSAFDFLFGFLGATAYFTLFTWKWQGQTPGKRALGIKVVKLNGEPLTLWNSFERFGGYSSSASLLLSGFFQYFWDKNHQTTHDKISETIVIDDTPIVAAPQQHGYEQSAARTPETVRE
jgi:uncharacterized RDD family membrane protein YckC